ncbi:MAG: DegT/DnrJ/EryC1/StrS family aminotransferase, partial [Thermoplasmata archaeon]|nr:DegT/DnrJ/EryC1/StrS family aminotransferase [Thermoplasmata archaeon]
AFKGADGFGDTIAYPARFAGNTVEFIGDVMDEGKIIMQTAFPVDERAPVAHTRHQVFVQQCQALIQVAHWLQEGRVCVDGRRVIVAGARFDHPSFSPAIDSSDARGWRPPCPFHAAVGTRNARCDLGRGVDRSWSGSSDPSTARQAHERGVDGPTRPAGCRPRWSPGRPIPFLTPRLPDPAEVAHDYAAICGRGVFTNSGPVERRFGAALATWIGRDVGVSVTASATTSIQLACRALFRPDRRYALVASFTAPAGPLALRWAGYEPVLLDIEPESWQPDSEQAQRFLSRHVGEVAGILLTTTFGTGNAAIAGWEALAQRHGLALVIDSAPGFGSTYATGEALGARGDCEIFSFHATKTLAVGEGGAIAARDRGLVERFDRLKNFGYDDDRRSLGVGLNAKLPELASAIGLRQLDALPGRLDARRERLRWYAEALEPAGCQFQAGMATSAPSFVPILLPSPCDRHRVGCALRDVGIGWRAYYNPPVHRQPSFGGTRAAEELATTEDVAARIISLPLDEELSREDVNGIAGIVSEMVGA